MTLTQIEVFCAVAELQSMTLAANKLNMTQPGVSRIISEIEGEYDTQLFIREKRNIYITPHGKICYESAIKVLKEFELLKSNLTKEKPLHELHVGCSSGLGPYVLKQASILFQKEYPTCLLHVTEDHPADIVEGIKNGVYNIGFIQQKIVDINIETEKIGKDRIILVAKSDYRLNSNKHVYSIGDIANESLIFIKKGSGIRFLIDSYAESQFVSLNPIWNCNSGEHALKLVEDGFGVSLLSNKTVDNSIRNGVIKEIKTDFTISREYFAVWRKVYNLSSEEELMIDICKRIGETYNWENSPIERL